MSIQPGVLTSGFILVAPAPNQGLAEAVFPTELGEAFLTPHELAGDLQLELAAKVASQHRSAPLRWRGTGPRLDLAACVTAPFDRAALCYSGVCLILGVHRSIERLLETEG